MHDVHHAIVGVNVVIGVLVVHCELVVVRVVPVFVYDDAVVRRTLVLIAFIVAIVFIVAILHRILLYWRYSVYMPRRGLASAVATGAASAASPEPTGAPAEAARHGSIPGGGRTPALPLPWLALPFPERVDHLVTPERVGHECRLPKTTRRTEK